MKKAPLLFRWLLLAIQLPLYVSAQMNSGEIKSLKNLNIGLKQYEITITGSTTASKNESTTARMYSYKANSSGNSSINFKGVVFALPTFVDGTFSIRAHKYQLAEQAPVIPSAAVKFVREYAKLLPLRGLHECWVKTRGAGNSSSQGTSTTRTGNETSSGSFNMNAKLETDSTEFIFKFQPPTRQGGSPKWSLINHLHFKNVETGEIDNVLTTEFDEDNNGKARLTYDKDKNTYTIIVTDVVSLENDDSINGITSKTSGSETTSLTITIKPLEDFVIKPMLVWAGNDASNYTNWLPNGNIKYPQKSGNKAVFKLTLYDDNDQPIPTLAYMYKAVLKDVSNEKGICINYPNAAESDTRPDLRFNLDELNMPLNKIHIQKATENEIVSKKVTGDVLLPINCYDYGASGELVVTVMVNGEILTAVMKEHPDMPILLPKRKNNKTKIAEIADEDPGADDDSDNDTQNAGNTNYGDGYSKYEEYRGFVINGQHTILDPKKKDLFVYNNTGVNLSGGYSMFTRASDIVIYEFKSSNEINEAQRTAHINRGYATGNKPQSLVLFAKTNGDIAGDPSCLALAYGIDGNNYSASPSKCKHVLFRNDKASDPYFSNVIAHELAHTCGVQHHGDDALDEKLNRTSITKYSEAFVFIYMNNPKRYKKSELIAGNFVVGNMASSIMPTSSSGDIYCPTCYLKASYWGRDEVSHIFQAVCDENGNIPNITQNRFCTSPKGTGYNATRGDLPGIFGDAANERGNCMKQFQVKDK